MKPEQTVVEVLETKMNELSDETIESLKIGVANGVVYDLMQIDENHCVLVRKNVPSAIHDEQNDIFHGLDVNVGVAAAITAGGRLFMSSYKNRTEYDLYYSDTDSIIINKELSSDLIGGELGLWKLEHKISKFVALAPKTYGMELTNGKFIGKIKGFNLKKIKFGLKDFYNLLFKNTKLELSQEKFKTSLLTGKISINEISYNLCVTNNKRHLNYIELPGGYEIFSSTSPIIYDSIIENDDTNIDSKK